MGTCRRCKILPARGPRKHYCDDCWLVVEEENRLRLNERSRRYHAKHDRNYSETYHHKQDALKKLDPDILLDYVGVDSIKAAETPLRNKLRIQRERDAIKRGSSHRTPRVDVPAVPKAARVTIAIEARLKDPKGRKLGNVPFKTKPIPVD